jgi:hypothetical protein
VERAQQRPVVRRDGLFQDDGEDRGAERPADLLYRGRENREPTPCGMSMMPAARGVRPRNSW